MRKEKFCCTSYEEAETHIWADFYSGQVIVETNKKASYDRLLKKLGEPNKKQYVKEKVRQILSKTNIIGQAKGKIKEGV